MESERFHAIDGLRTMACIGIVMMHMKSNNSYKIDGFFYNLIIPSFTDFVFLFMVISAFGLCCGYYDKMLKETDLIEFYKKRYSKVFPFFAILVFISVGLEHDLTAVYEGLADLTLVFGLFPNNIEVIGVGWFIGVVFAFYFMFPFFCTLISTKKKAWWTFAIALLLNFLCVEYFKIGRSNIVYCACYFFAGGIIYLYREKLRVLKSFRILSLVILTVAFYYWFGANTFTCLMVSSTLLIFALTKGGKILQNRLTKFISCISMEIYLSHMVIFRLLEKLHLNYIAGNAVFQYVVTVILTLIGSIVFSMVVIRVIKIIKNKIITGYAID